MKKMFIDNINKHGDGNLPGPGRYNYEKKFASLDLKYSMASKLRTEE